MYGPFLEPVLGQGLGVLEPALLLRHHAQQLLGQQVRFPFDFGIYPLACTKSSIVVASVSV
jgi:hypothetical protein